jgi:hypothetical protein
MCFFDGFEKPLKIMHSTFGIIRVPYKQKIIIIHTILLGYRFSGGEEYHIPNVGGTLFWRTLSSDQTAYSGLSIGE